MKTFKSYCPAPLCYLTQTHVFSGNKFTGDWRTQKGRKWGENQWRNNCKKAYPLEVRMGGNSNNSSSRKTGEVMIIKLLWYCPRYQITRCSFATWQTVHDRRLGNVAFQTHLKRESETQLLPLTTQVNTPPAIITTAFTTTTTTFFTHTTIKAIIITIIIIIIITALITTATIATTIVIFNNAIITITTIMPSSP